MNSRHSGRRGSAVVLLTGGGDKPYALGLASALTDRGIPLDFIGSDEVSSPELRRNPLVHFLNLRGEQSREASIARKCFRLLLYYVRLIRYAASAEPPIFHVLWNNKLETLDRLLLLYYRLLGKKVLFTAHNVNARKRDGSDNVFNRFSLGIQYRLVHGIFVHTEKMKDELIDDFSVPADKIRVIPFGINETLPKTTLTRCEARNRLSLNDTERVLLFFGNIAPYKGLEHLIDAVETLVRYEPSYRLLIAGKPKNCPQYWSRIKRSIAMKGIGRFVIEHTGHIPDESVEVYFKAADVLILPYKHIFQSGVLFTSYYFGLPVIAADVGSLREDIVEGKTGCLFRPEDSDHLCAIVETYFQSELYRNLELHRSAIAQYAGERNSWAVIGALTHEFYAEQGTEPEAHELCDKVRIANEP